MLRLVFTIAIATVIAATVAVTARAAHKVVTHTSHSVRDLHNWLCIHHYEGSWSDPGSPYYGGLQMDYSFQESYGPEFLDKYGTANHWPVWAQIKAARRARDGWYNPYTHRRYGARGYYPWPNTARYCGLIR